MSRLEWRGDEVSQRVAQAFQELVLLYFAENVSVISEPGAFADFPDQDIVDTGRLRASTQFDLETPTRAVFSWPVEYGPYVHEGYVMKDGRVVSGRPWTQEAIDRLKPEETLRKLYRAGD
jgi:hypothetical protein